MAVAGGNALADVCGFCPNQLVFGNNPNFPSNLTNKLPALEPVISSDIVQQNLTAIHSARKAFIGAESSERISRALHQRTRQCNPHVFRNGDSVYYKCESSNQWKGPGSVIGVENQTVMIKHGGSYVEVHPCRVMLENSECQGKQSANYKEIDTSEETKSKQDGFETKDSDQSDENDMLNSNKSVGELVTSGSHRSSSKAEINEDSARNYQSPVGDTENIIQNRTF